MTDKVSEFCHLHQKKLFNWDSKLNWDVRDSEQGDGNEKGKEALLFLALMESLSLTVPDRPDEREIGEKARACTAPSTGCSHREDFYAFDTWVFTPHPLSSLVHSPSQ